MTRCRYNAQYAKSPLCTENRFRWASARRIAVTALITLSRARGDYSPSDSPSDSRFNPRLFVWSIVLAWLCLTCSTAACGADRIADLQWYDAETQTLRRAGSSYYSPAAPDLSEPRPPRNWTWQPPDFSGRRRWNFSGIGDTLATWLQVVAWILLVVAALWFVLFVLRSYRDLELGKPPDSDKQLRDPTIDVEKLADLPFDAPDAGDDLLGTVRRKYEQGAYGEAIVLLFGYQLLALDKNQVIRILRGKTNRQYVREVARSGSQSRLRDMLAKTMVIFEDYFFGDHPVTREQFEACWTQLDEFHSIVETTA